MTKRIIGLTGGIATGKTTVTNYLASTYNLPILDADIYAREAVSLGSPVLDAIAKRYGQEILLADGNLHRQKLGEIIFNREDERNWLESLIHPYVRDRFVEAIIQCSSEILVLVVPLLFEAGMTDLVTEIWVVHCSQEQQLQRLMQRNHLNQQQAQVRINSQLSLAEKVARANIVLDNSSSLEVLLKQVDMAVKAPSVN
ncbi:dephospho-CoA kinase [Nostoc linckia z18]|uniref:Dephospho-CoA kinase n=2 Tax=Nostoc linckia TaxID=92942 RepID=A0A9Q5ZBV9_NOSLI|nr:dephospho-CoA kinase [Nostoc linckia]PHK23513.1 dephospho-CoA kinase [Nostoc linckia z15]PHK43466.1 dephospho-CoA kinase [Nostoc linckia z16]PHJ67041.1 dephospho-CoA kinase [Nostoc linckia z1]PHJ67775.1 dephospho-CoA kinase [Nostoc linckia z3]PHJ77306.1 dephospho-CoA kinase [Nostoc linckia z2]